MVAFLKKLPSVKDAEYKAWTAPPAPPPRQHRRPGRRAAGLRRSACSATAPPAPPAPPAGEQIARPSRYNGAMSFVRLYGRVLDQLGPDRRVGWLLAIANVALAVALFAEPVCSARHQCAGRRAGQSGDGGLGRIYGCCFWPGRALACLRSSAQRRSRCLPIGWHTDGAWRS